MNPFFSNEMAEQHIGDLRREAEESRRFGESVEDESLVVRAATRSDREDVRLLAALEGVSLPSGPMLVAQLGDELVAALPLDGGRPLADPFRPSAQLVELLQLRARQLRPRRERPQLRFLARLRSPLRTA